METEHLFMIPKTCLEYQKYADVHVEITKISIMPTVRNLFLLRKISRVGIPKSTVLIIIFRVFMWTLSLRNTVPRRIIHLQCIEMISKKTQDHLIKERLTMELLFRLLILKWHRSYCYSIIIDDDAQFKNISKRPAFVLRTLKTMLNFEVGKLSLQELEYEMDRTDYSVDYIKKGYCGHPNFTYVDIQFKQATNGILSHSQEVDNPFNQITQKKQNWFPYILFTDLRKTHSEQI